MSEDSAHNPEDEFRDMLNKFLSGDGEIDPERLASAAGLPNDPEMIKNLIVQLQSALQSSGDGINWGLALEQAKAIAAKDVVATTPAERAALEQAFHIAALWLDEATYISELTVHPRLLSRTEWITATMPIWTQLAEPVALSIANSLTDVLRDQAPEEMSGMIDGASRLMRNVGGTLFAMQLGQVVGQLASEVVSGGDVGIPLLSAGTEADQQAAVLPQNVAAFGAGLDIEQDQVQLYLAVRELAHARLFRHAKWMRLQLMTSISEFAQGIRIDTERLEQLATDFDPSNPEELREAMVSGALIPPKSESQLAALGRLETMLALIEGWVDVVTAQATTRLPKSGAIAETVRRRRAAGGPAESAFSTLVGLELRPRRLREAAAMWQKLTDEVGPEARDELWSHPDLVPTSEDIDDPAALVARLTGPTPAPDDIDQAIEDLLNDTTDDRPHEARDGSADDPSL
ncbi:zinc-dependent metalloprotease [Lacisediminihabitans sp.]|jgi:putative hydrolase|uniref:zinc-dependent metalloprotease n=1 Tax=Lacisediminihabitans sp. TaxID=2787631 RepID=UPI002F92FC55